MLFELFLYSRLCRLNVKFSDNHFHVICYSRHDFIFTIYQILLYRLSHLSFNCDEKISESLWWIDKCMQSINHSFQLQNFDVRSDSKFLNWCFCIYYEKLYKYCFKLRAAKLHLLWGVPPQPHFAPSFGIALLNHTFFPFFSSICPHFWRISKWTK